MRNHDLKKVLILNLPYFLIGLYVSKIGQAYRLSNGIGFSAKLLHIGAGFTEAFALPFPSFYPNDLLIGMLGGALLRLAVWARGKNAKRYRKGVEYGSARWANAADIKPFLDAVPDNNVILTRTESLTMSNRPVQPKYARNKNVLVIGGSGSGKTRFWLKPNLMQCHSSYVVTDPKGTVLTECGNMLLREGYRIRVLNTINFKKSMRYNPFAYIHSEKDILKIVTTLIVNTKGEGKSADPFWEKAETLLYTALIGYIHYEAPEEEQNFSTLIEFINAMEVREDDEEFKNPVDYMFEELEQKNPNHFAVRQYKKYKLAAGWTATGARSKDEKKADELQKICIQEKTAVVKAISRQEKRENPPTLYDLTLLQREVNRLLGFTAQQTLDYLQNLYEKKICTYPRTDSRYLTSDMEKNIPALVKDAVKLLPWMKEEKITVCSKQVINDQKVTDHHALLLTRQAASVDPNSLSSGEKAILELVATRLILAVGDPYLYEDTKIELLCGETSFSVKGRVIKSKGFQRLEDCFLLHLKSKPEQEEKDLSLSFVEEKMRIPIKGAEVKEGRTTAPKHFTEDTLLAAMETAGAKSIPEEAERKGLGTSATRAGILEKLVKTGFLERKKNKKIVNLIPTERGKNLIQIIPEQIKSPMLTAEWEQQLLEIEKGRRSPEQFLMNIQAMISTLVKDYEKANENMGFTKSPKMKVGICPRCGRTVYERKQGFFCENSACKFALWKNNRFFLSKKKELSKAIAVKLLKDGKVKMTDCYSEKTGKTYDAWIVLEDTKEVVNFKLEFINHK